MRTRNDWYGISLGLFFGIYGASCSLTSATPGVGGAGNTAGASASGAGAPGTAGGTASNVCVGGPAPVTDPMAASKGPCDIYALDGGPCVAAHSTVRALYASFGGPLYQLRRADGMTRDIAPLVP
ncbi:MAG TPA: arabinofuranosidase catalytic domain-containing protein, partial [Polyangiaceae bacterium]|nr:arabinofuranosidase catalytic domain-containing protein [Polyangiaceae bacterium]